MRFSPHWTFGIFMMALTARAESPAARGSCKGPQLKLDSYLKARKPWVSAVQSVSKRLSEYGEVDHCAVLDIQWMGSEAIVHASVPDGRSAIRHVATPDALNTTVIALLALPDAPLALAAAAEQARESQDPLAGGARAGTGPSTGKVATARPQPKHAGDDRDEPTTNIPIPALDVQQLAADDVEDTGNAGRHSKSKPNHPEIGAWTTAARVAGSDVFMAGLGAGAFGHIAVDGWLLGGSARAEKLHNLNDHRDGAIDSQSVIMFGPTIGRRVSNGPVWVDVIVPLQVTFESSTVQPDASQPQTVDGTSYTDFRVGAMVRASWELTKSFRLFGSLDADVSPARLVNPPEVKTDSTGAPVEQRPPRFSLGLSVGVFWGAF